MHVCRNSQHRLSSAQHKAKPRHTSIGHCDCQKQRRWWTGLQYSVYRMTDAGGTGTKSQRLTGPKLSQRGCSPAQPEPWVVAAAKSRRGAPAGLTHLPAAALRGCKHHKDGQVHQQHDRDGCEGDCHCHAAGGPGPGAGNDAPVACSVSHKGQRAGCCCNLQKHLRAPAQGREPPSL